MWASRMAQVMGGVKSRATRRAWSRLFVGNFSVMVTCILDKVYLDMALI